MPRSGVLNTSRSLSPTRSTMAWKSSLVAKPCWMELMIASSAFRWASSSRVALRLASGLAARFTLRGGRVPFGLRAALGFLVARTFLDVPDLPTLVRGFGISGFLRAADFLVMRDFFAVPDMRSLETLVRGFCSGLAMRDGGPPIVYRRRGLRRQSDYSVRELDSGSAFGGVCAVIAASMPCSSDVGVGGQPGIPTSTGITVATRPRLA